MKCKISCNLFFNSSFPFQLFPDRIYLSHVNADKGEKFTCAQTTSGNFFLQFPPLSGEPSAVRSSCGSSMSGRVPTQGGNSVAGGSAMPGLNLVNLS